MFTAAGHESGRLLKNSDHHGFERVRLRTAPKAPQKSTAVLAAEVAFGHRNEFFSSLRESSLAAERKFYVTPPS
jgi:hypothetical protein